MYLSVVLGYILPESVVCIKLLFELLDVSIFHQKTRFGGTSDILTEYKRISQERLTRCR